jgi:hypothetical protein
VGRPNADIETALLGRSQEDAKPLGHAAKAGNIGSGTVGLDLVAFFVVGCQSIVLPLTCLT